MRRAATLSAQRSLALLVLAIAVLAIGVGTAGAAKPIAARVPAGTILVTNLDTNSVTEISPVSHSLTNITGPRSVLNGPLGIAVTPDGATAYVTDSLGDTITPIGLKASTPELGTPIRVGSGPVAIAITPNGTEAYVSNFNANTVTPIDLTTHPATPGKPIRVGAGPWSIAVSPDGRSVLVSNSESNTISDIDVVTRTVTTVTVGNRPGAIAVAPDGRTAYVANGDQVTPVSLTSASPRPEAPISVPNGPEGIAITPTGATAYTANSDDTVTPIDLSSRPATAGVPSLVGTLSQPDGIAISPDGTTAYAANASDDVTPINLTTSPISAESPVTVGTASFGIALVPDEAPIARLRVIVAKAGRPTRFDASRSIAVNDPIASYHWNFGDGTSSTTATPTTTHVYKRPGHYDASVTETSRDGTTSARTFTGQTVSNNGSDTASAVQVVRIAAPLRLSPARGTPGESIGLHDSNFPARCTAVSIFFDGKLIASTTAKGHVIDDNQIVVPGDAPAGTDHIELSCTTSSPWAAAAPFVVVATVNHLSEFSVAMPTPGELQHHLVAAGGISILLLLLSRVIVAGFPSEWMDRTYDANKERIRAPFRRRFPRLFIDRTVPRSTATRVVRGAGMFVAFVATAGLINSFLDKSFGWNRTTLWLYLGQCLGIATVTVVSQLPIVIGGLREHRRVHLQVLMGAMVIALVCVSASRAIGLSPGYCYGLIAVFLLNPPTDDKDDGRLHALSSVVVLVTATAAFLLTVPVFHLATQSHPSALSLVLDPALNVTFLGGFASLAFGMFPLPFLPGHHIARWNKAAWVIISGLGLIGFVAVLLTPGSGSAREIHHVGLIPLVAAFGGFALLSLGFMAYFHLHPERREGPEGPSNAPPPEENLERPAVADA